MRELPGPDFWDLIQPEIGKHSCAEITERGFGSDFTAVVEGENGPVFVKAMCNRPGGRRDSILRERDISTTVAYSVAPPLLWHRENGEWIILGYEVIEGRRCNFKPGSTDLNAVVDTLNRVALLQPPTWDWQETRWDRFASGRGEATLFAGDALLHTDINPSNFLVDGTGRAWLVDWAWPTIGAAFIDPALLVVQLVSAGHTVEAAESWAARCAAWAQADPRAIDAFAAAVHRMHAEFVAGDPEAAWLRSMESAARAWVEHRRGRA
ncbi:protein kinase [Streptomyces venezuelae]|uniref:protein kinase n=1 Tax=Streptomyces venezuelae TaxID=54571 RepID=UPI003648950A